ncbi:MAG: NUDIX hydrolase [Paracoccus sp. (in: a-proteobacteria)]
MNDNPDISLPWSDGDDFIATKLILTCADELLACLRDDFDHIPFPNHWDLPGGGREGTETAPECALRELQEEFGLRLPPDRLERAFAFASPVMPGRQSVFYTGQLSQVDIGAIHFGDEGQCWRLMPVAEYITHPHAVPHFRRRVAYCLGIPEPSW